MILGSASKRRADLLRQLGLEFTVYPAPIDESICGTPEPASYVCGLSIKKTDGVLAALSRGEPTVIGFDAALVICADTIVVSPDSIIFGKPADGEDAKKMLRALSGKWHTVYTGVTLTEIRAESRTEPRTEPKVESESDELGASRPATVKTESESAVLDTCRPATVRIGLGASRPASVRNDTDFVRTRVKMLDLADGLIDRYVDSGEPDGKAGAYAIQERGSLFVERIDGCYSNVVGLPLPRLSQMFGKMGYDLI